MRQLAFKKLQAEKRQESNDERHCHTMNQAKRRREYAQIVQKKRRLNFLVVLLVSFALFGADENLVAKHDRERARRTGWNLTLM